MMKSEVTTEIENCVRVRIGVGSNFRGRIFEIFRSFENRVNFKNNHHVSRICKNNQNSVSNFKNSHLVNLKSLTPFTSTFLNWNINSRITTLNGSRNI